MSGLQHTCCNQTNRAGRDWESMGLLLAFSEFLASFSAPHQPDNRMGCPSPLSLLGVGTAVFLSDKEQLDR